MKVTIESPTIALFVRDTASTAISNVDSSAREKYNKQKEHILQQNNYKKETADQILSLQCQLDSLRKEFETLLLTKTKKIKRGINENNYPQ